LDWHLSARENKIEHILFFRGDSKMKKLSILLILCLLSWAAQAVLVDSFSDTSLAEYTKTVVHDGDASKVSYFQSPSGALQCKTDSNPNIEQILFLRDDYSVGVGQTLMVDISERSGLRNDIGIAVCFSATPPEVDYDTGTGGYQSTRQDYCAVYVQADNDNLKGIYVNGTTAGSTIYADGSHASSDVTQLFITRDSLTQWSLGYISGAQGVHVFATGTLDNTDIGSAIGFFTDMRNIDTVGDMDNLRIVPEPATLALLGIGLAFIRKRK
jgi:hypothetical protein